MNEENLISYCDYMGIPETSLRLDSKDGAIYNDEGYICDLLKRGRTRSGYLGYRDVSALIISEEEEAWDFYDKLEKPIEYILKSKGDFLSLLSLFKVGV